MKMMHIVAAVAALTAFNNFSAAKAADLPSKKEPPAPVLEAPVLRPPVQQSWTLHGSVAADCGLGDSMKVDKFSFGGTGSCGPRFGLGLEFRGWDFQLSGSFGEWGGNTAPSLVAYQDVLGCGICGGPRPWLGFFSTTAGMGRGSRWDIMVNVTSPAIVSAGPVALKAIGGLGYGEYSRKGWDASALNLASGGPILLGANAWQVERSGLQWEVGGRLDAVVAGNFRPFVEGGVRGNTGGLGITDAFTGLPVNHKVKNGNSEAFVRAGLDVAFWSDTAGFGGGFAPQQGWIHF